MPDEPIHVCMHVSYRSKLTFYTAAARLQHPGVHVGFGVGEQLVSSQVCVMRGGDEVVTQRLLHVLIYLVVQRVENVTCGAAHETREACWEIQRCRESASESPLWSGQKYLKRSWSHCRFLNGHGILLTRILCYCQFDVDILFIPQVSICKFWTGIYIYPKDVF